MKYGIYFAYWEKNWGAGYQDYIAYIKKVKKLGFDILEISCASLKNMDKEQLLLLRKAAEDEGMILTAGYGPSAAENLGSADEAVVKNGIAFYKDVLKKLELLDIHTLGGGIYSYWPVDYNKPVDKAGDWERSVKNVRTVSKIAGDLGIDYCLEVLNRFEGYLLNTAAEARQFVEEVDVPAVKIMLDTFHMNIEENSMTEAILTAGDKLGHFHVGENNRKVPGQGNFPWNEIGRALKAVHYKGNIVMEPFVTPGGEVGNDIKIWRDIIPNAGNDKLDQDAARSVQYLRFVMEQ